MSRFLHVLVVIFMTAGLVPMLAQTGTSNSVHIRNGGGSVVLKASTTGSITLQLPSALGTNGQVLTTTSAGELSWSTPAGGGGGSGTTVYTPSSNGTVVATVSPTAAASLGSFTGTFVKVTVTPDVSNDTRVQLPSGSDGQVVYLRIAFTEVAGSFDVAVLNSDGNPTIMSYDGDGADVLVAHLFYSSDAGRWVIFPVVENP